MHFHLIGICGTFMGSLARLLIEQGHQVSGSDRAFYAPMSEQLEDLNIQCYPFADWDEVQKTCKPDIWIVGNIAKRGDPWVESLFESDTPWLSGPACLAEYVLKGKRVLAVSGTHGKTTTTSLLAWILECAGLNPGFLIGGVSENFGVSARLTDSPWFVIEADEYDTAFFDKRPKFLHYFPEALILNNLEFDHADIYDDLAALQKQFHYLLRTLPPKGCVVLPHHVPAIESVLEKGCWTPVISTGLEEADADLFFKRSGEGLQLFHKGVLQGRLEWPLLGQHNVANALSALGAAFFAGVPFEIGLSALKDFQSVKRRLQYEGLVEGVHVYDDFAHHPTAICATLEAVRAAYPEATLWVMLQLSAYSLREGIMAEDLPDAWSLAKGVWIERPVSTHTWDWEALRERSKPTELYCVEAKETMMEAILRDAKPGDVIVKMSKTPF